MRVTFRTLLMVWLLIAGQPVWAAPVVRWDFGAEESTPLTPHGGVHRDVPGPRPPEFPDFEKNNTAVKLDGKGAYFSHPDQGGGSSFDFTNGDAITIEAWVLPDPLLEGENVYIIGKGRTGGSAYSPDNQNWALRLRVVKGQACPSFLFATKREKNAKADAHWHRWTATNGITAKTGWHHVAVAYQFGKPESIRGWLDGLPIQGSWDMGGETKIAPVTDDDAVWIGSAQNGNAANSYRGSLDAIAIHRELLNDATIKGRFRREGGPVVVKPAKEVVVGLGEIPADRVLMTFHEGMPAHDRWFNEGEALPPENDRFVWERFLLHRLPQRYDAWGIRESWKGPVLTRLAADVTWPKGTHQLLMRTRGLTRLWINGQIVARSKPQADSPSGEEPITPVAKEPAVGHRIAQHRQQEISVPFTVNDDRPIRIVLETLVGAKKFRTEPSEMTLAIKFANTEVYTVVAPANQAAIPLTDAGIEPELQRLESRIATQDDRTRRQLANSEADFWKRRHQLARQWVTDNPVNVFKIAEGQNTIDAFIAAKIHTEMEAANNLTPVAEATKFHTEILPLLREECFRCHGEKDRGGLKLNSREAALKAGDSEKAAIVPGKAHASELIARLRSKDAEERMPPKGNDFTEKQIKLLEDWINAGAVWPRQLAKPEQVKQAPVINDIAFVRRVYLDTVGVVPTAKEVREFVDDANPNKRPRLIDQLLNDERFVDHQMGYWQDVLAENPTLLNSTLNTTGPFRWFLHDRFRDDQPFDRIVTELIMMRGSKHEGGSAGFGIAAENDAPFAAKAHILGTAFLGIELQCARCHDSPFHSTKQQDLYAFAAMLERKPISIPKSSSVPAAFFENKPRESLIKVTSKPGVPVAPRWAFATATGSVDDAQLNALLHDPQDTRERVAALITAPQNTRFAQVIVNRIWRRLMGSGFVEPPHDWEGRAISHPELLDWLAREFVANNYSLKHITRLILTSKTYQREAVGKNLQAAADQRFFNAPDPRRMTAEQVIDSLHVATGTAFDVEELTFDPDGRRNSDNRINLGKPKRAWMLVSTSNERDRPSLSLPKAQAMADVLEAFGWSGVRQVPRTDRETAPNVLQPGILANGRLTAILSRANDHHMLADWAIEAKSPAELVTRLYWQFLNRPPTMKEHTAFTQLLASEFDHRIVNTADVRRPTPMERLPRVTWSNHLSPDATTIQLKMEERARNGPPPDPRLQREWRERYEDVIWTLINTREFVWLP